MQTWISLASDIGDLLALAAAATDLAATRARSRRHHRPRRRRGTPAKAAITARYHVHHDTCDTPCGQGRPHTGGVSTERPPRTTSQ